MIKEITSENIEIYYNLAQAYEAEFSSITKKMPDIKGIFMLDTHPTAPIKGYYLYEDIYPIGFILIDLSSEPFNVNEFYVVPSCRNKNLGEKFFYEILDLYPGKWQVKQLEGALKARQFWLKVIGKYSNGIFQEGLIDDSYWGKVTRQTFIANKKG